MEVLYLSRGAGKTTQSIELSAKTNAYIVCIDQHQARYVSEMAVRMGEKIPYPITFNEFIQGKYYAERLIIDNADMLLQYMSKAPIEMITITEGTKIINNI